MPTNSHENSTAYRLVSAHQTGESDQCSDDESVQRGLLWGDAREGRPANGKAPGEVDRPGPAPPTPPSGGFQGRHCDNAATPNVRVSETAQKSGLNCATLTSRLTNVHWTTLLVPQPRPPVSGLFLWNALRRGALHRRPGSWWPKTPRLQPSCRGPGPPPL
jgi:hypothetical protein